MINYKKAFKLLENKIEYRLAQLKYEDAHINRKKELYRVFKIFMPEALKESEEN